MTTQSRATKKQQELLRYVREFIHEHGYGPSYREIMRALDYKSVSTVAVHVDGLVAKGFLTRKDNAARSLEVAGSNESRQSDISLSDQLDKQLANHELSDEDKIALDRVKKLLSD